VLFPSLCVINRLSLKKAQSSLIYVIDGLIKNIVVAFSIFLFIFLSKMIIRLKTGLGKAIMT
jgi:hypothetical protein